MDDNALTPEQQARSESLANDFARQLARVGVDMQAARERLHDDLPPVRPHATWVGDELFMTAYGFDVPALTEALRQLPDGAGTDAFVAEYNARHDSDAATVDVLPEGPSCDAVESFLIDATMQPDASLDEVLAANAAAGLPTIDVTPLQGKLLSILVTAVSARRVLEIGTLGGYSTIWMARALPAGGTIVTLEANPKHAAVARANFERAGVADRVDLRLGPALETLPRLAAENPRPFDFVFIDADKASNAEYLEWGIRLARPGAMIIVDNVVREGSVIDPESTDASDLGVRHLFERIRDDRRITATALQTVGAKGWDGFAICVVNGERR